MSRCFQPVLNMTSSHLCETCPKNTDDCFKICSLVYLFLWLLLIALNRDCALFVDISPASVLYFLKFPTLTFHLTEYPHGCYHDSESSVIVPTKTPFYLLMIEILETNSNEQLNYILSITKNIKNRYDGYIQSHIENQLLIYNFPASILYSLTRKRGITFVSKVLDSFSRNLKHKIDDKRIEILLFKGILFDFLGRPDSPKRKNVNLPSSAEPIKICKSRENSTQTMNEPDGKCFFEFHF